MISHLATVFVLQALVRYQGFASIAANSIFISLYGMARPECADFIP